MYLTKDSKSLTVLTSVLKELAKRLLWSECKFLPSFHLLSFAFFIWQTSENFGHCFCSKDVSECPCID